MAMSLADELPSGDVFTGWPNHQARARKVGFRGSAAFFALLLAAASSGPAEETSDAGWLASEAHLPDGSASALHQATAPGHQIAASSKFSRRRMPLSVPVLKGSVPV
jgi:hypothetical protein